MLGYSRWYIYIYSCVSNCNCGPMKLIAETAQASTAAELVCRESAKCRRGDVKA